MVSAPGGPSITREDLACFKHQTLPNCGIEIQIWPVCPDEKRALRVGGSTNMRYKYLGGLWNGAIVRIRSRGDRIEPNFCQQCSPIGSVQSVPGNFKPAICARNRAIEESSSAPIPAASAMTKSCRAADAMGKGNFCWRPRSETMPRSFVKIETALRGA